MTTESQRACPASAYCSALYAPDANLCDIWCADQNCGCTDGTLHSTQDICALYPSNCSCSCGQWCKISARYACLCPATTDFACERQCEGREYKFENGSCICSSCMVLSTYAAPEILIASTPSPSTTNSTLTNHTEPRVQNGTTVFFVNGHSNRRAFNYCRKGTCFFYVLLHFAFFCFI